MTDPTPDEAAAALQAVLDVLDAGGRHCGCDPELYGDSDFIGFVSDTHGRGHREVRGAAIRVLLAERARSRARVAAARTIASNWAGSPMLTETALANQILAALDHDPAPDRDGTWTCVCRYMNTGPICTHCGKLREGAA